MIRKKPMAIFSMLVLLFNVHGCTLIGFIAGLTKDAKMSVIESPVLTRSENIKPARRIKIQLQGNQVITGTFQGLEGIDSAEYIGRYTLFRSSHSDFNFFPAIDDTVTIAKGSALLTLVDSSKYLFAGLNWNTIILKSTTDRNLSRENLDSLVFIADKQGQKINPHSFQNFINAGIVPVKSQADLLIRSSTGIEKIPLAKIEKIVTPISFANTLTYTLVGAFLDVSMLKLSLSGF